MARSTRGFTHDELAGADLAYEEQRIAIWVRQANGGGDGRQFGVCEDTSPATLIPDWVQDGLLVSGFVLETLARQYGLIAAEAADDLSHPCVRCARHTYGPTGTLCDECAAHLAGDMEQGGGWSPRED